MASLVKSSFLTFSSLLALAAAVSLALRRGRRRTSREARLARLSQRERDLHQHLAAYMGVERAAALIAECEKPPALTTLRVNTHLASRKDAIHALREMLTARGEAHAAQALTACTVVDDVICLPTTGPHSLSLLGEVVVVDRRTGESLLRGADVYAPGVLAATSTLANGAECSVVAADPSTRISHGQKLRPGVCCAELGTKALHVGNGTVVMGRADLFGREAQQCPPRGLAVKMTQRLYDSPAMGGLMSEAALLQNLPSVVAVHVLDPQPGERVVDLCAAPGGKATHIAALMLRRAAREGADKAVGGRDGGAAGGTVIACDRSVSRLRQLDALVSRLGLGQMVHSRRLDSRFAPSTLGPASFDRVLLDPPCSALGVRPRLRAPPSMAELDGMVEHQRALMRAAVELMRPGGVLVYSTCTTNPEENEAVMGWAMRECPELRLCPQPKQLRLGGPGLAGCGLDEHQRRLVQRIDPTNENDGGRDHIGFFIARFTKTSAVQQPVA